MRTILFIFVLITSTEQIFAQLTGKIFGKVTNKQGEIQSYVTVILLSARDSSLIKGDVSNQQGIYNFDEVSAGDYLIKCSYIGFQTYYSTVLHFTGNSLMHDIRLTTAEKLLKGTKITAQKPLIEVKADKTVFNVEQSIQAAGTNALDVLRKSPGVQINRDDQVNMRGKQNVLIYIDGKPTYLDQKDLTNMLKNISSNDIESVELITNPSAKYDASGNAGIINIKLKKNKKLGTNGAIQVGVAQGKYDKENMGIQLNHRDKNINVFGNYSMNRGKNFNFQYFDRTQNNFNYNFKSGNVNDDFSQSAKAGIDYYFKPGHIIGAMIQGMYTDGIFSSQSKTYIGVAGQPYNKVLIASNRIPMNRYNINGNINYKYEDTLGRTLNIDLDMGVFNSTGKSYQPNTYWNANETQIISQSTFKNNTPTKIDIYSGKADYEQNLWGGKLGLGIKSSYVSTDNDFRFYDVVQEVDTLNLQRSNHFVYHENINAAYISFNKNWTRFSLQTGLRAEHTLANGMLNSALNQQDDTVRRNYISFFPSAGLTYTINALHQLGITYSKRIDRPNYQDLNPFENKLDELTYEKGNAFLRPQFTHSIDLTHTYRQYFTTTLNYSHTRDMFMQTTDTTEFSRTYVTQKNFATMDIAGINISFPVPVKKWWMVMANLNAYYNDLQANFEGRILHNVYYTYTLYADNTFQLPKGYSVNISGWFSGPNYWGGTFKMKPMGSLDIGMQKTFLQKKLTAKISLSDVFKTQQWYAVSNFSGLYVDATGNWESRQLRLNVSYRFGNTQVERQRDRKTGSDDVNSRIKGK